MTCHRLRGLHIYFIELMLHVAFNICEYTNTRGTVSCSGVVVVVFTGHTKFFSKGSALFAKIHVNSILSD